MSIHNTQLGETEFLNTGNILVTNSRFIVAGQTYAMNGVTSVKQGYKKPDNTALIIGALIGILMFLFADSWGVKLTGLVIAAGCIYAAYTAKGTGSVILQTASGEVQAVQSQDITYIQNIISALNNAIIHRG